MGKAAEPSILLMTVTRKVIYDWGWMEIQESIPVLCSYLHICCLLLTNVNNIHTYRCLWQGHICGNPYKLKAWLNPRCGECFSPTECLLSLSTSALNKTLTLVCRCNRALNALWGLLNTVLMVNNRTAMQICVVTWLEAGSWVALSRECWSVGKHMMSWYPGEERSRTIEESCEH